MTSDDAKKRDVMQALAGASAVREEYARLWRDLTMEEIAECFVTGMRSFGWRSREEAHHRERAAAAAAWMAAREACAEYADREEAYSSKRANTDNQHDQVWYSSSEATAGSIASHIRALLPPADAMAALAEVVDRARREGMEEAARMLDEKATELQRQQGIGPDSFCVVTLRARSAAIRARAAGGAA